MAWKRVRGRKLAEDIVVRKRATNRSRYESHEYHVRTWLIVNGRGASPGNRYRENSLTVELFLLIL